MRSQKKNMSRGKETNFRGSHKTRDRRTLIQNKCTAEGFIVKLTGMKHGCDTCIVTAGAMKKVWEQSHEICM